jgi:two-component system sensor histidine kinase KdpD
VVASVVSAAALSYLFIPPRWELSLGKRDDAVALVIYVFVAFTVATLLERLRAVQSNEAQAIRAASDAVAAAEIERHRAAFFAAAGHNLRTPLTCIRTAATTLASYGPALGGADQTRLLEAMVEETGRLERLVSRVLQVAAIQATGVVPVPETIDLAGVVQTTVDRIAEGGAGIELCLDEPDPPLELDPLLVEQVLLNLVENAVAFSPPSKPVQIVGRQTTGAGYVVHVIDSGPGVPVDQRELIFREFHSSRHPDGSPSTGLGLSIAAILAAAQGGSISVGDAPDGGAMFTVTLREPMVHQ